MSDPIERKTFHIATPGGEVVGSIEIVAYGAPDKNGRQFERTMTKNDWLFVAQIAARQLEKGEVVQ